MNMDLGGPNKSGYKFNEVTSLTGVKPYVLRFWETEFDHITPVTNDHGQKIYSPRDVDAIEKVKKLLFDDKLTIAQAKGYLDRDIIDFEDDEDEEAMEVKTQTFDIIIEEEDEEVPPPLIQPLPNEIKICAASDEEVMALKTVQLKKALDAIIEKNSTKTTEVLDVKKKLVSQKLADKDIVCLVSAKKKLSIVLSKIDSICATKSW